MDIVHSQKLAFVPTAMTHRTGGFNFKIIFEGSDNDPVNNYQLAMIRTHDFISPVHKHNFDQFRYSWDGDFNIGPNMTIHTGELCYHPEGVSYGPQKDDANERTLLIFQFGGASGQGYMSLGKQREANIELEKTGHFRNGRWHPNDGGASVDGFQALWESANKGKKLQYPKGRYHGPVLLHPDNFGWKRIEGEDRTTHGAWRKFFGTFSERESVAQQIKLEKNGRLTVAPEDAVRLLIVKDGNATVDGQAVEMESAVRLQPGKSADIASETGVEFMEFIVPTFK